MILILILFHNFVLCAIVMFWNMGNIVSASCVNVMSWKKKMVSELGPEMLCPIVSSSSFPQVKTCIITSVCTSCICSHISASSLKIPEGDSTVQFMLWFPRESVWLFIQFVFSDLFSNLPTVCHSSLIQRIMLAIVRVSLRCAFRTQPNI